MTNNQPIDLTDLVDGDLTDPTLAAWLAEHPVETAEVAIARRVRLLVAELRLASIEVPAGFEVRLMERVRQDATLLDLLDLSLAGIGHVVIELLAVLFGMFPPTQAAIA